MQTEDIVLLLLDDVLPPTGGVVALLKAYLDRGARTDDGGVMCVAAALFEPAQYKRFSREWNRMLKGVKPGGVPYFHATDFFPGAGEHFGNIPHTRRNEIARKLPALINRNVLQVVAITFRTDEFRAVAPLSWQQTFGSLHGVAVQMCAGAIGHWANERNYDGPVAYVLESGDNDETDVENRIVGLASRPDQKKHIRYFSHSFVPKGGTRGLEVADYFAWQWNKFTAETLSPLHAGDEYRDMRRDFQALVMPNKQKYRVFVFTGDALEKFLLANGCTRRAATPV